MAGRLMSETPGECERCGEAIDDVNVESWEITGQILCADCAEESFDEEIKSRAIVPTPDVRDQSAATAHRQPSLVAADSFIPAGAAMVAVLAGLRRPS